MNLASYIIIFLVAVAVGYGIIKIIKRKGRCACCDGSCPGCGGNSSCGCGSTDGTCGTKKGAEPPVKGKK